MSQQGIYTIVYLAWLAGAACFVLGLHRMNSPATARDGNRLSAAGMVIAAEADNPISYLLAFIAMVFGSMNVVGGYVVTDRMLQMFRKKPTAARAGTEGADRAPGA